MKPALALDLDDILFPLMDLLVPFFNAHYEQSWTLEDFHSFEFEDIVGSTREDMLALLRRFVHEIEGHPEPVEGSLAALSRLADEFRLYVVTSREDSMRERTLAWVEHHFAGHFEDVFLCNSYVTDRPVVARRKVDVCREVGAVALVDDSLANVTDVAGAGMRGILFGDFAWNRTATLPTGVVRVAGWDDVVAELLEGP